MQVLKWVEVKRQLTWRFYITRILPVGLFMALTLHFGNVVYLYLTVSFIQMLKVWPTHLPRPLLGSVQSTGKACENSKPVGTSVEMRSEGGSASRQTRPWISFENT